MMPPCFFTPEDRERGVPQHGAQDGGREGAGDRRPLARPQGRLLLLRQRHHHRPARRGGDSPSGSSRSCATAPTASGSTRSCKTGPRRWRGPTGGRTSSWRCSRTSCAIRWPRSSTPCRLLDGKPLGRPRALVPRGASWTARCASWPAWSTTCWTSAASRTRQGRAPQGAGRPERRRRPRASRRPPAHRGPRAPR